MRPVMAYEDSRVFYRPYLAPGALVDLSYLPHIFALSVFIAAFRPLVRRVGAHVNLWFLGWAFLLAHYIAELFATFPHGWGLAAHLIALWGLDLCGLAFVVAAATTSIYRIDPVVTVEMGVPILLQAALATFGVRQPALLLAASGLFLVPGVHMLVARRYRHRPIVVLNAAFAVFGLILLPMSIANPTMVANGALSLLFLSAAYLYFLSTPRVTRGVVAAVAGLAGWGLTYPLNAVMVRFFPDVHPARALLELPQYLIIAGIILTLLEEHVLRTERMAMHDPLTDLPNRRLFEERLVATMEEARLSRTTIACLVIDVDNFKTINDTLGHSAGDQLLRALSVRLSWHMSPRDILARTGGDEFTALLAGVTDEHHLRFIASAMMSAASVPIMIDGRSVDVRISVGIALSPDHADDVESLRRAADEAMYSAKRRGGSLLAFAGEE